MKFDGAANQLLRTVGKPPFIYGTAWKKEATATLVGHALAAGFRAVDTAAQPKHYREDLVGEALRRAYKAGLVSREDVFVQTKFTPPGGQEEGNAPYAFSDPLETQISKSISSSLHNFRALESSASTVSEPDPEAYVDCLILHSPLRTLQLTLQAWKLLETYVPHRIRTLGLSNCDFVTIRGIAQSPEVKVKPVVVQNRFYPATRFDADIRRVCASQDVVYESFWTLTGNPALLKSNAVETLAREAGVSKQVALYSLVIGTGVAVLNGTTNPERMAGDLRDVERVRNWSFVYADKWNTALTEFRGLVDE